MLVDKAPPPAYRKPLHGIHFVADDAPPSRPGQTAPASTRADGIGSTPRGAVAGPLSPGNPDPHERERTWLKHAPRVG